MDWGAIGVIAGIVVSSVAGVIGGAIRHPAALRRVFALGAVIAGVVGIGCAGAIAGAGVVLANLSGKVADALLLDALFQGPAAGFFVAFVASVFYAALLGYGERVARAQPEQPANPPAKSKRGGRRG